MNPLTVIRVAKSTVFFSIMFGIGYVLGEPVYTGVDRAFGPVERRLAGRYLPDGYRHKPEPDEQDRLDRIEAELSDNGTDVDVT